MLEFLVDVTHLGKELFNLAHTVKFIDIFNLTFKEGVRLLLNLILLLRRIGIVLNSAFVSESIMHGKFLFKFTDFTFEFLQKELWV